MWGSSPQFSCPFMIYQIYVCLLFFFYCFNGVTTRQLLILRRLFVYVVELTFLRLCFCLNKCLLGRRPTLPTDFDQYCVMNTLIVDSFKVDQVHSLTVDI